MNVSDFMKMVVEDTPAKPELQDFSSPLFKAGGLANFGGKEAKPFKDGEAGSVKKDDDTKKTGKFEGKSNALGHGGRAAQLAAQGVPGGVIGEIARRKHAAPAQANFHGVSKSANIDDVVLQYAGAGIKPAGWDFLNDADWQSAVDVLVSKGLGHVAKAWEDEGAVEE